MATYPGQFMQQFFDASGDPLNLGKIYTYSAGTTTPAVSYTDQAQGTQNTNPVVCDSAGRCQIWLPANTAYKLVVKTSADVTLQTIDQVYGMPDLSAITIGNLTVTGNTIIGNASGDTLRIDPNAVTWTNNPTHSGNHVFSGNVTVQGNLGIGNAVGDTVTVTSAAWTQATGSTGWSLVADTSDGADNSRVTIAGGGTAASSRGAFLTAYGNEVAVEGGKLVLQSGEGGLVSIRDSTGASVVIASTTGVGCGAGALATNATAGFLYVPTCAGTPTGTPGSIGISGLTPIIVNTTNNKLYFYSSAAWRDAGP